MNFGDKLVKLRKKNGLSQEDLANKLEVSRQSVYKWETEDSVPEIAKIKSISKLFNISLDVLLDDAKDIDDMVPSTNTQNNIIRKYRRAFKSKKELDFNQAEYDNGYSPDRKTRNPNSESIFASRMKKMRNDLSKLGITDLTLLQGDLAACFFIDDKQCAFGFYYRGAIQFICPYENYIASDISNSGQRMTYRSQSIFGVGIGPNGVNSIGVGSMPQPVLNQPSLYYLSISYFDENGNVNEFKMSLHCSRLYTIRENKIHPEDALIFNDLLSDFADRSLKTIHSKLITIPAIAERIRNRGIIVHELDIKTIIINYNSAIKTEKEYEQKIREEAEADKKKRNKTILITIGIILAIIILIVSAVEIKKAVDRKNLEKYDQSVAMQVIEKIDTLDNITLNDKNRINSIASEYSALSSNQKSYVTNYSKLVAAQNEYQKLYMNYLEESTKDDPTRNITLLDLKGTWESSKYVIYIDDLGGGKSVWWKTYNKQTASYGYISGVASNLPSSIMEGYDCEKQVMKCKLYHWVSAFSEYESVTLWITGNDNIQMALNGLTYNKK